MKILFCEYFQISDLFATRGGTFEDILLIWEQYAILKRQLHLVIERKNAAKIPYLRMTIADAMPPRIGFFNCFGNRFFDKLTQVLSERLNEEIVTFQDGLRTDFCFFLRFVFHDIPFSAA